MKMKMLQKIIVVISITLLNICIAFAVAAQDKEKCLDGNCKNGYGIKKITTTRKDPLRFDQKPLRKGLLGVPIYTYYEAGQFKGGELNGNGYRFDLYFSNTQFEEELGRLIKANIPLVPNENQYTWFEQGEYKDGVLNGKGFLIEYDNRNSVPIRIREGEFVDGALTGQGIKIKFGMFGAVKDSSGKFIFKRGKIFKGLFDKDICKECTVTEKRAEGEGSYTGKDITEYLFSGWVIKDYVVPSSGVMYMSEGSTRQRELYEDLNGYAGKAEKVKPYRALFIGGVEIAKVAMTDQPVAVRKVELGDGAVYTGQCDDQGKPYGFGIIDDGHGNIYEGMVDNNQPNGYGLHYALVNYYREKPAIGGRYVHGKLIYGAVLSQAVDPMVVLGGVDDPKARTILLPDSRDVYTGPFTKITYKYDAKDWTYSMSRLESGNKINGMITDNFVTEGKTEAERKKQRVIINGMVKIHDLVVGDVVVVEGMASPVINKSHGFVYLKNNRSLIGIADIKLSKYNLSDFDKPCNMCGGTGSTSHIYQRKPEQVTEFFYRTEKIVGDFAILTHQVLDKRTVTKYYLPETRTQSCYTCNATGYLKNINELRE
ncbi:MAG: hypothetical protein WAT20_16360 [Ferruginibacter sp.]|nr:hypothetical protein [Chitinophagaceae bacterium]